ncbi:MAG: GTP-binding protein [Promethearchaeota archaeon]
MKKPIKILISGYFNSGKSTLIKSLDQDAVVIEKKLSNAYSKEKTQTTTGFDLGRIIWLRPNLSPDTMGQLMSESDYENNKSKFEGWDVKQVELKGVPGKMHFSIIRSILAKRCDGVVFLIDGSEMESLKKALEVLEETKNYLNNDIPIVIIANKSDKKDFQGSLKISSVIGEDVLEGSAITKKGIPEAIILILKRVLGE